MRSVSERGGDAFFTAVVEGHDTTVAQWQLDFSLTLLAGNFACHGTVHFVGQPVFAGHGFHLEHVAQVFIEFALFVGHILVVMFHGVVHHVGFR